MNLLSYNCKCSHIITIMFFSNYVAKIASWVYTTTTYNTPSLDIHSNYLTDLTNISWISNLIVITYSWNLNILLNLIYTLIFILILLIISSFFSTTNSNSNTIGSSTTYLQLIEDELGSGTKLLYVYITLFGYIVWFFLHSYLGFILPWVIGLLPLYASLLVFLLFGIPLMLLLNYRAFFMTYIRGNVGLKPLLMELVLDYINLIAFFLRFNIQLIRILIITAIFFLYNELFEEFVYPNYMINVSVNLNLTNLILIFANMIYEVGHFWIIFGMQSSATLFILTILFQFLYTQVFVNKFQTVFLFKRSQR